MNTTYASTDSGSHSGGGGGGGGSDFGIGCKGFCCRMMSMHAVIDGTPVYYLSAIVSALLLVCVGYLAAKLHLSYYRALSGVHATKRPIFPFYHSYTQLAVFWFVLQTLSTLLPRGFAAEALSYVLLAGQGFMDNAVVVFLCHKSPGPAAVRRTLVIALLITAANLGVTVLLATQITCDQCASFAPQTSMLPIYAFWTLVYLLIIADRAAGQIVLKRARPMLYVFVNFLAVVYAMSTAGLAFLAAAVDVGFCVISASLITYSVMFAPFLYYVFTKDSSHCATNLMMMPELSEALMGDPLVDDLDGAESGANGGGGAGGGGNGGSPSRAALEARFRRSLQHLMERTPSVNWINSAEVEITRRIGVGAYGEVFEGVWNGTSVAVKSLFAFGTGDHESGSEAGALEEFGKEIAMMSHLRHPNVLLFLGACFDDDHHWIVTEYMANGNVFDLLKRATQSSFSWSRRLKIARDTARGMAYLHSFNPPIIHRDLKTQNLLVDGSWRIKVADFGLSRILQNDQMSRIGTPNYAAPEVIRCSDAGPTSTPTANNNNNNNNNSGNGGNKSYTEKADVFGYGVILWELASLQCPYKGLSAVRIARGVAFGNLRPPMSAVPAACPREIVALMQECWAGEPTARPSFREILARLEALTM